MADAVLLVDGAGQIVFANASADVLFRAGGGGLLGRSVETLISRELRDAHRQHRREYMAAPSPRRMGTRGVLHACRVDGTELPVDVSLAAVEDAGRRLVLVCIRDVTWREQLLHELRESERRHRAVVEAASEVFYHVAVQDDPFHGEVQFVSPQCQVLTGQPPEAFLENPNRWIELVHPEDVPSLADATQAILTARREGTRHYRIRNEDGGYRHVADRVVPLTDARGAVVGYRGVARDVTEGVRAEEERRRLDLRLREAERMETVGRLAGGVAHDFNNILTVILGFCETALDQVDPSGPVRPHLEEAIKAARRAADVTRQLLGFSRKQVISRRVLDLDAHLSALEPALRRVATERIEVTLSSARDLWPICMDPAQVDQILINLVANARDAIPAGGRVAIATANVSLDEAFCAERDELEVGDYVQLSVSDDGSGMDETTLRNAFVPFFTTKQEGRGTGIGLASVYGIVTQNRGRVEIESEVGRGTTVRVYLPRWQGDEPAGLPEPSVAAVPARGDETVLLVEDDDDVRMATRMLLAQLGYTILEAATPAEALRLCEAHPGAIDLLLTDVVMPQMGGVELAERVRALRPGIAALFVSGYANHSIADLGTRGGAVHYLAKPFGRSSLAAAIRTALGRGATSAE